MENIKESSSLVSVIAVCYNHSSFVISNLDSIINQTYKNIELIIIDDYSTDNSREVISEWINLNGYKCKFIKNEKNLGLCKTLNKALTYVNGKYVNIIATDDVLLPNKLDVQVKILNNSEDNIAFVASDMICIDKNDEIVYNSFLKNLIGIDVFPKEKQFELLIKKNYFSAPSLLIKRDVYNTIGVYDETLKYEDYNFLVRCLNKYNFIGIENKLVKYRVLENSLTIATGDDITKSSTYLKTYLNILDNTTKERKKILAESIFYHSMVLYQNGLFPTKELIISFKYLRKLNITLYIFASFLRIKYRFIYELVQKIKNVK